MFIKVSATCERLLDMYTELYNDVRTNCLVFVDHHLTYKRTY